jgi:hypothetical protein
MTLQFVPRQSTINQQSTIDDRVNQQSAIRNQQFT